MLSRVLSPDICIYSKLQTVLALYQWTDNKSYKDQSYKGPGLNSKFEKEKEKERREEEGGTTASSYLTVLSKAAHSGPSACDSEREPSCPFFHLNLDTIVRSVAQLQSAGFCLE